MIPIQQTQKLLQRSRRHLSRIRDRLTVLPRQIGELSANVSTQMPPRVAPREAILETLQKRTQQRSQRTNLSSVHARASRRLKEASVWPITGQTSKAS